MRNPYYLPVLLDLSKFSILIVGGGNVAYRKAKSILQAGGRFFAVALEFIPEFIDLMINENIQYKIKKFEKEDIADYNLIFCCTNDRSTNELVYSEALSNSALVNVVDTPELCNFIMPAIIQRGKLLIAISTQGVAPFLAKDLKDSFENMLSPLLADVTQLAGNFREKVMSIENLSENHKKLIFEKFLEVNWQKMIYEKGYDIALSYADSILIDSINNINSVSE